MLHGNSIDCKAYCSRCVAVPQTAHHSYCMTVQWTTRFNVHVVSIQSFNVWPFLGLQSLPFMLRGSSMHCKASSVLSQALRPCRRFSQNNCNTAMSTSSVQDLQYGLDPITGYCHCHYLQLIQVVFSQNVTAKAI